MMDRQVMMKVVKIDMSCNIPRNNGTQMTQVGRAGNKNGTEESRHKKTEQKGKDVKYMAHGWWVCKE
jgi:hypothetical protein